MKKLLILPIVPIAIGIGISLVSISLTAQEHVSLSIHQDARFAFVGDDKGNPSGTIDLLMRFKMQGKQQQWGYMIVFPEFEYAEIIGTYKRWSANVGYTFNRPFVLDTEASVAFGYGWIDRYGATSRSLSASGELAYVFKHFKISAIGQFTQRSDLKWLYGKNEIRFSGFIGFEFNLN